MKVAEATKPLEGAGYDSTINTMAYNLLRTQSGKDEDHNEAGPHRFRRHGGKCTLDGCVYSALLAISSMLRDTRLSWNIAKLVKGSSDDHETQPLTTNATGGGPAACVDQSGNGDIGCCDCLGAHCRCGCPDVWACCL